MGTFKASKGMLAYPSRQIRTKHLDIVCHFFSCHSTQSHLLFRLKAQILYVSPRGIYGNAYTLHHSAAPLRRISRVWVRPATVTTRISRMFPPQVLTRLRDLFRCGSGNHNQRFGGFGPPKSGHPVCVKIHIHCTHTHERRGGERGEGGGGGGSSRNLS